ncbi:MAG: YggS family pyridoxal phosphate-dependent enzyme [Bacilli bacterium]|nr:YggS family pyridoxal phosphate-dependent enzyme [Bacilli bacterium]
MIRKDIKEFLNTLPKNVTLVAATKYIGPEDMEVLLLNGVNNFGENRTDSFLAKYACLLGKGAIWHFIGHLQRNKASEVINKIDYLHSLDSLKLAELIEQKREKPLKCFVEVSINLEESKNGVPYYETKQFIKELLRFKKIELVGLMMMAIKESNENSLEEQFAKLRILRDDIEKELNIKLPYLSMGMSDDYKEAIKEGATHIRLGRILYNL